MSFYSNDDPPHHLKKYSNSLTTLIEADMLQQDFRDVSQHALIK